MANPSEPEGVTGAAALMTEQEPPRRYEWRTFWFTPQELVQLLETHFLRAEAAEAEREPPTPDLRHIIADMQAASEAVDEANGTSDYNMRLVALALIARHYLRELRDAAASHAVPEQD